MHHQSSDYSFEAVHVSEHCVLHQQNEDFHYHQKLGVLLQENFDLIHYYYLIEAVHVSERCVFHQQNDDFHYHLKMDLIHYYSHYGVDPVNLLFFFAINLQPQQYFCQDEMKMSSVSTKTEFL